VLYELLPAPLNTIVQTSRSFTVTLREESHVELPAETPNGLNAHVYWQISVVLVNTQNCVRILLISIEVLLAR